MESNIQKNWILEFLLRQPIEDSDIIPLLPALCPSCQDHRLMKTLLLRRVSSEIQKDSISEKILESLELVEELDHEKGIKTLDSMKEAYYAVVVYCVMRLFKEDPENLLDNITLWNIWRGRLLDMERGKEVDLASDRLNYLKNSLVEELCNGRVCDYMFAKDTKSIALEMVRKFLEEATYEMGPSFLDLASKTVREYEEAQGLNSTSIADEAEVRRECSFNNLRHDLVEKGKEVPLETGLSLVVTILKAVEKELGGAKASTNSSIDDQIAARQECTVDVLNENLDTNHADISGNLDVDICDGNPRAKSTNSNPVVTPECREEHDDLNSTVVDLHDVVKDPLPDKLCMIADVSGNVKRESVMNVEDNQVVRRDNTRNQAARQSLMERNSTAHAYRWVDDEIESSSEGSANPQHPIVVHERSVISLTRRPTKDQTGRRKKRKWSSIEEQTLYDAVKEYGKGNWALILEKYSEIFEDRTGVDLKDKWRNLTK
ncbi:hypothetical protein ACHQM5_023917 [Ranunculus cassubicifolius]